MRIPFGKYRGEEIDDLPSDYLRWLVDNDVCRSEELREEVERVLGERRQQHRRREQAHRDESWREAYSRFAADQSPAGVRLTIPAERLALLQELLECGFKALAMKKHPDRGGSVTEMQQLNELRSSLRAQLG